MYFQLVSQFIGSSTLSHSISHVHVRSLTLNRDWLFQIFKHPSTIEGPLKLAIQAVYKSIYTRPPTQLTEFFVDFFSFAGRADVTYEVSNVENMATGPKIADLSFGQETVTSPIFAIPSLPHPLIGISYNNSTGTQRNQSVIKY